MEEIKVPGYVSPAVGHHLSVTIAGLPVKLLRTDKSGKSPLWDTIKTVLLEDKYGIEAEKFCPFGSRREHVPYTATLVLSESHFELRVRANASMHLHTYDESESVVFDFYSCRGRNICWESMKKILLWIAGETARATMHVNFDEQIPNSSDAHGFSFKPLNSFFG